MGANYPAEYGRSMGSVLNVILKSGNNKLHGSAYEFLRNSIFDANNFFDNRRGAALNSLKRIQYGGTVLGTGPQVWERGLAATRYRPWRVASQ